MKKIVGIFFLLCATTCVSAQHDSLEIKLISYRVPIRFDIGQYSEYAGTDVYSLLFDLWYKEKIGPAEYNQMTTGLWNAATAGKIKVYDPLEIEIKGNELVMNKIISKKDLIKNNTTSENYTFNRDYPPYEPYDTVLVSKFDPTSILYLEFFERWTINKSTMEIKKQVLAFGPVQRLYAGGEPIGYRVVFYVKME